MNELENLKNLNNLFKSILRTKGFGVNSFENEYIQILNIINNLTKKNYEKFNELKEKILKLYTSKNLISTKDQLDIQIGFILEKIKEIEE